MQYWFRAAALALLASCAAPAAAADHKLTVVTIEYQGSKAWMPLPIVVKKGDKVVLKLINNVPSGPNQHSFTVPAYSIDEVITRGEPRSVEFVADKAGIFPIRCQLDPAHIDGQLVVLE